MGDLVLAISDIGKISLFSPVLLAVSFIRCDLILEHLLQKYSANDIVFVENVKTM